MTCCVCGLIYEKYLLIENGSTMVTDDDDKSICICDNAILYPLVMLPKKTPYDPFNADEEYYHNRRINIINSNNDVKVFRKIIDGQGLLSSNKQSTGIIIKGIKKCSE